MKKVLTPLLLLVMMAFGVAAQQPDDNDAPQQPDPKAQEKINSLRIAYLTDKLGLTPEQAERFWPIYREYAEKRREIRSELHHAAQGINKENPDPKKQQELVDLSLKVKQRVLDLEKDYSGRLMKVVTAEQMLRLPNAEAEFRAYLNDLIQQRRLNQQRRENFREKNQRLPLRN
jgi:Spy/CpxP family protein refolding chaperone